MGVGSILQSGISGLNAAKTGVATSGHNIANATTEGYSRQRVQQSASTPIGRESGKFTIGQGTTVNRIERLNNEFIEKQIRGVGRDLAHAEEREVVLKQAEEVFNEMNGEGLNRLMSKFFNEFRKLSNEPDSHALRESVRESSQALVGDFQRLSRQIREVSNQIDTRIEAHAREVNRISAEITDLNVRIRSVEMSGGAPNDLLDKRDLALKKLNEIIDVASYHTTNGEMVIDIKGLGPLVTGRDSAPLATQRSPANDSGKPDNGVDLFSGQQTAGSPITSRIKGGKLGALIQSRDETLQALTGKLDTLAYELSRSVNEIHRMGYTGDGLTQVNFFAEMDNVKGAAERIQLSESLRQGAQNIAAAAAPQSPGDNRIAVAISGIQGMRLLDGGRASFDDFYNGMVGEVGVASAHNREALNQNKDVSIQLGKMREQLSGVSIDEETTQLMQYQHAFDASARVIRVADELLKTVLSLKQ